MDARHRRTAQRFPVRRRSQRPATERLPPAASGIGWRAAAPKSPTRGPAMRPREPPPRRPLPRRRRHGGARSGAHRTSLEELRAILDRFEGCSLKGYREPAGFRRRHARSRVDVRRRGAGRRGGQAGPAVRRPLRAIARPDAGGDRARPRAKSTSPTSCPGGRPATARRRRQKSQICLPFIQRQIELCRSGRAGLPRPALHRQTLLGVRGHHEEPRPLVSLSIPARARSAPCRCCIRPICCAAPLRQAARLARFAGDQEGA